MSSVKTALIEAKDKEISELKECVAEYEKEYAEKDKEIERLRAALEEVVDCPFTVDSATVPKIGIHEAPPYQVVVVLSMAWTRLQKIREALAGGKDETTCKKNHTHDVGYPCPECAKEIE